MKINRRNALLFAAGASAPGPVATGKNINSPPLSFEHGVASGDPLCDRVIIWTRISGIQVSCIVAWQISLNKAFTRIVNKGSFATDQGRDFTVKVDALGLKPNQNYYYRFAAQGVYSPIGKTRTLPLRTHKVVFAVANCALYPNGYFNAYRAISTLKRVDCLIHLGDYIYEHGAGPDDYGMKNGRKLNRISEPEHEIISLNDYRTRHAQYKRDKDLQAAHARCAWICVFDDHEVCNNPWMRGAENHNPENGEGDWLVRKAASLKAYNEWMPIRDSKPGALSEAIYRRFRFGQLAELIMIETRLLGRSKQVEFYELETKKQTDGREVADYQALRQRINDPSRTLFGVEQSRWLAQTFQQSVKDGVTWQVLGNQVLMARVNGPDLIKAWGADILKSKMSRLSEDLIADMQSNIDLFSRPDPFAWNLDAWDGYPAERERLYDMIKAAGARVVVLSGDTHTAWANQLNDQNGLQMAVEIGITSITSPNRWYDYLFADSNVAQILTQQNDEIIACDDRHHGFTRLTLTKGEMICEWMKVDTILKPDYRLSTLRTFTAKALPRGIGPLI